MCYRCSDFGLHTYYTRGDIMLKKKSIRLDYLLVKCLYIEKDNGKEVAVEKDFDLTYLFKDLTKLRPQDRQLKDSNGDLIRIQILKEKKHKTLKCEDGSSYKYWELQILKQRSASLPGVATSKGEYNQIEIKAGEVVSEDISALYDPQKCTLLMYRKKEGITPVGLEKFLSELLADEKYNIIFQALISKNDLDKLLKEGIYKKLDLIVVDNLSSNDKNPLCDVLSENAIFGAKNAHITLSLGKNAKKEDSFVTPKLSNFLQKIVGKSTTTKALLTSKINGQDYDLIKERKHEIVSLAYDKKNPLTHKIIFSEIEATYLKNLDK